MTYVQLEENAMRTRGLLLRNFLLPLCLVTLFGEALPAMAIPLTWSLNNVRFADGGIATGSFVADASNQLALDFNFSVSGGDELTFPAFTYTPSTAPSTLLGGYSGPLSAWAAVVDGTAQGGTPESRLLLLSFVRPLTDAGGGVALALDSRECFNCDPSRLIVSGSVQAATTPVPEPSTLFMLSVGLMGILSYGWKRKLKTIEF